MKQKLSQLKISTCYHCGDQCKDEHINSHEKVFCCNGCKLVYELINKIDLCEYYDLNASPGTNQKVKVREDKFSFLDDETIKSKIIQFKDEDQSHVSFYLPQMHCSSCVWLLENLNKANKGIVFSQVNFLKKELKIVFKNKQTSLRQVAELITSIGYEPHISLNDVSDKKIKKYNRSKIIKIGIAGFCFANIMMLSFPEYFSGGNIDEKDLKSMFSWLNLALSLPVLFYCASDFFISAWNGIKQKFLNIDAPIALAVLITFSRSVFEIISGEGAGYLDSMTGIVFFMLVGRYFQDKTYNTLTFNRDYTSYFPLAVTIINVDGKENQISISELKAGQRIKVHSNELIPADSILFMGKANIDYSFVTGESLPIEKSIGEIIYAGGKQTGSAIEMEVIKEVSQSYLTQLWNSEAFTKEEKESDTSFIHNVSKYFTLVLFTIAAVSAGYWYFLDPTKILNSVTSILIVACPCALLLSATFTNANMLKILQNFGFYAKNAGVIEKIKEADTIVFDKTGTITLQEKANVEFSGIVLNPVSLQLIRSLANQSIHPLSKAIVSAVPFSKSLTVKNFIEVQGKGVSGIINDNKIAIGSSDFIFNKGLITNNGSMVYVCINNEVLGHFTIRTNYRNGLNRVIQNLSKKYKLSLVSGDNQSEKEYLQSVFENKTELLFEQKPSDKLHYIEKMKRAGKNVIMIGDGLNDAGALKVADVGIALTDNINNFSPSCDVIFQGKNFDKLDGLLKYCSSGKQIILGSFIISILYNIVGLYFAFFGNLQPVIAAILMPVSSISIILFTTGMSTLFAHKLLKRK